MTRVLTLPGWQSSGPDHWQTHWERLDARVTRVEQDDWEAPRRDEWLARLRSKLSVDEPTVLVGHSLGCILAVHAAGEAPGVVGALLVAPSDPERPGLPDTLRSFTPVPLRRLPFPSIVVASRDDEYCTMERSRQYAEAWGARLIDAGARGHLNSATKLGTWPEGRTWLRELLALAPFVLDARLARDTHVVGESALSLLLLMNDARYPWFIVVPKRSAVSEVFELEVADQHTLGHESAVLSAAMVSAFSPDKLNVGALGNVVRQLHVHHVARTLEDPAWPGPVWGHSPRVERDEAARRVIVERLFAQPALARVFDRR